jgi:hypothetical protein
MNNQQQLALYVPGSVQVQQQLCDSKVLETITDNVAILMLMENCCAESLGHLAVNHFAKGFMKPVVTQEFFVESKKVASWNTMQAVSPQTGQQDQASRLLSRNNQVHPNPPAARPSCPTNLSSSPTQSITRVALAQCCLLVAESDTPPTGDGAPDKKGIGLAVSVVSEASLSEEFVKKIMLAYSAARATWRSSLLQRRLTRSCSRTRPTTAPPAWLFPRETGGSR